MPTEQGQRVVHFNQSTNGLLDSPIQCPRGAKSLRITKLKGSCTLTDIATQEASAAVALIRLASDSSITSIAAMQGLDILWSRVIGSAITGTPANQGLISSFRADEDFGEKQAGTKDKPGSTSRGFQMLLEQDGAALSFLGLFTINYEIDWPETSRTRDLGRIRRMGMMNQ